ncbi:DUF3331 domain-containing protein [Burkholderia orbicola]|uniref:DUF3331 domain-containing protein n=1 Tax=Burkholderia orbicola TaxID=2978683 RepID=UPI003AF906A8
MVLRKRKTKGSRDWCLPNVESAPIPEINGNVIVELFECSSGRLYLRWSEPGRCHYGEQVWGVRYARRAGVCAFSGSPIDIGDAVYVPIGRPRPLNARAMILIDKVEEVLD